MMDVINDLFDKLENKEPFALTRFNDGEMNGIIKPSNTYTAARGDQFINKDLKDKLKEAFLFSEPNYYKGIPCSKCFPDLNREASNLIGDYPYKTYAVVQTNRNLQFVVNTLGLLLEDRRVIWVGGEDQDINKLFFVGIKPIGKLKVKTTNAWENFDELKDIKFRANDVIFLSCGPLAEVLIYEWFKNNPWTTFFDIGSVFDPLTRNVWHRCHLGTLPKCEKCN